MASRYSDQTNKELYRVVKSFNQRVRRHETKGEKHLPTLISVSQLKASFTTEKDLKKQEESIENIKKTVEEYNINPQTIDSIDAITTNQPS